MPLEGGGRRAPGPQDIAALDEVLAADKITPQVAARLCGSFGQWRKYDAGRQALMRGCLEAIAATDGLSKEGSGRVGLAGCCSFSRSPS
mgnify:CR=1 FL=1